MKPKYLSWTLAVGSTCVVLLIFFPLIVFGATNCAPPPFVSSSAGIKPNVLIILDNSGSMINNYGSSGAYTELSGGQPVKYYGYFDSTRIYQYDNNNHYFKDVGPTVSDGAKLYGAYNKSTHAGNSQAFSGNWLNWALMTRLDVSKTVLTGGRLGGDANAWVVVGTPIGIDSAPPTRDYDDSASSTNLYYTPFHQNISVRFYEPTTTTWGDKTDVNPPYKDYIQRTGYGAAPYVPLFKIFKQGQSSAANLLSGSPNSYGNPGETATGTKTVTDITKSVGHQTVTETDDRAGAYYKACYFGPLTGAPPQGVVQQVASRVRLGYMRFNEGTGPGDDPMYVQGAPALSRLTSTKGTSFMHVYDEDNDAPNATDTTYYEVIGAHADGGQIVNPCGDDTTVDTWQVDPANSPNKIPILSIVKNINEEQCYPSTPLGEVLHEAMRYFQQKPPCYLPDCASGPGTPSAAVQCSKKPVNPSDPLKDFQIGWDKTNSNLNWDPFYFKEYGDTLGCVYSSIILLTDGDPTWDYAANKCPGDPSAQSVDVSSILTANGAYDGFPTRPVGNGQFVDQIPYVMHTTDLRPELKPGGDTTVYPKPGAARTVTFYGILSYAGGTGNLLKQACITGGFQDLPYNQSGGVNGVLDGKPGPSSAEWLSMGRKDASGGAVPNTYYEASSGDQIRDSLLSIFTQITVQGTAGAVATVSQQTSQGDMIVRGGFNYKFDPTSNLTAWMGHLESYWPDSNGNYDFQSNPGAFCKDIMTSPKHCWDGGQSITKDVASQRNIFTYINTYTDGGTLRTWTAPQQVPFKIGTSTSDTQRLAWLKLYLNPPDNSVSTDQQAKAVIQWTRGQVNSAGYPLDSDGTTVLGTTYRTRSSSDVPGGQWILGDIIYSTPVIVGAPPASVPQSDPDFAAFQSYRSSNNIFYRNKVAYVGGNDGMVHAFLLEKWDSSGQRWLNLPGNDSSQGQDPGIGMEIWAYIPSNILPQLNKLAMPTYGTNTCQHLPMVDLAPQAYDVFINYNGTRQWRTVLIGGERGGGDVYFAIDVTDPSAPDYPRVIWEYSVLKNLAVAYTDGSQDKISLPYSSSSLYANLSALSLAWTKPAVGRITLPPGVKLPFWKQVYPQTQGPPLPALPAARPDQAVTASDTATQFTATNKNRHVAFMGGGFRIFQAPWQTGVAPIPSNTETQQGLFHPNLLAIDIETGYNIFQKIWPLIVKYQPTDSSKNPPQIIWPKLQTGTTGSPLTIPYAFADPVGLDVWNTATGVIGEDGFIDTLYFGDLTGYFYSLKLSIIDMATQQTTPAPSSDSMQMLLTLRQTKPIEPLITGSSNPVNNTPLNFYRYINQPVTSSPSAAWDEDGVALRVLFGTGKLDDKDGTINDDFYDGREQDANPLVTESLRAPGSFYNLRDPVQAWTIPSSLSKINFNLSALSSSVDQILSPPATTDKWGFSMNSNNLTLQIVNQTCPSTGTTFSPNTAITPCADSTPGVRDVTKCCNWLRTSSDGDCGEGLSPCSGGTPCWNCIFDFSAPGERVVDRPLIAGGRVYFSTVIPGAADPCLPGAGIGFTGNLYALDYMCRPVSGTTPILTPQSGSIAVTTLTNSLGLEIGEQATILGGIPSRPVLDSSGQKLFVQTSNAAIQVIGIPPSTAGIIRGWRQK